MLYHVILYQKLLFYVIFKIFRSHIMLKPSFAQLVLINVSWISFFLKFLYSSFVFLKWSTSTICKSRFFLKVLSNLNYLTIRLLLFFFYKYQLFSNTMLTSIKILVFYYFYLPSLGIFFCIFSTLHIIR